MTKQKNTIVCLMGPTASGKTDCAIELAMHHNFEIISVDSALVYRDMNIGTAKPSADELQKAPHHLIDLIDPSDSYSAAQFCIDASAAIESIIESGKIPLLVGGTMLYFRALQFGLADLPPADETLRKKLKKIIDEKGLSELFAQLKKIDPVSAERIDPNDTQRIQRALEVHELTGKTMTELWETAANDSLQSKYNFLNIAIIPSDRAILHERIEKRFDKMLKDGLIAEVKQCYERGDLNLNMPSMRTVGYRQVWQFLRGDYDEATMRERAIIATRQLAKRQLTWLRHWPDVRVLEKPTPEDVLKLFENIPKAF